MKSPLLERIILGCLLVVLSTAVLLERKEHGSTVERALLAERASERASTDLKFPYARTVIPSRSPGQRGLTRPTSRGAKPDLASILRESTHWI